MFSKYPYFQVSYQKSEDQPLLSLKGAQEIVWLKAKLTLSPADAVTLVFNLSSTGSQANGAIDDITLRGGTCSKSQSTF